MADQTRRRVLVAVGGSLAVGLAGCAGDGDGGSTEMEPTETDGMDGGMDTSTETETATETEAPMADLRVAHLSPDAPNVDVYVGDGDPVLSDVPFGAVSDYLSVEPGTYPVQITAAGDAETVVFDQEIEVGEGSYTVAAVGELAEDGAEFAPQVLGDDRSAPGSDTARVRVFHASPDAPAVDVTVAASGDAIVDGLAYGETATTEVPAGEYTLQIRGDTESNDGDVVAEFDLTLEGATGYTAIAAGYLTPDDEPADTAFDLLTAVDTQ